ncbi:hypothetical protein B0T25DRAFT_517382 [Lasiosphaeria hispida]|uniref:Uncharacterized protein n=1 Tax=Lasiosphaeria hispida TaxID=260671 RepID=A0AAJ0MGR0_9PEZI|nr:hypothetical protein B0T25DRAFT_517382 [Lasiosphaeria hispida]
MKLGFLAGICFVTAVAADTGDDFSNNLFTDLAPLLALFGERVTMQFMSQSMGWADNIILAMAPLGIITAIVGAIRVGGPSWLKAIIGRARESRAIAESELMSSTSNEVCELWNGQEIVRVMGEGLIREFILLFPKGSAESQACVEVMKLEDEENKIHGKKQKCLKKHDLTFRECATGKLDQHKDEETGDFESSHDHRPLVVIRNITAAAPNLTLNIFSQVGRGELYMAAVLGITLQFGVLIYAGFATRRLQLLKDGNPVADYAFPCTASGTLLLAVGTLLCAHVVESATLEKRYCPAAEREAQVIWLQRSGTVNDQVFKPFAIFPRNAQALITTSHRVSRGRSRDGETDTAAPGIGAKFQESITTAGVLLSICGFVVQFTGLRGMHWSASVAQLGAIIIMTTLRAWLRRNLAQSPEACSLTPEYELDWLAIALGSDPKAASLCSPKNDGNDPCWGIVAVQDIDSLGGLEEHSAGSTSDLQGKCCDSLSSAHSVMKIRRELGELAGWHGPASVEAISLARAIEEAMGSLFGRSEKEFTWSLGAFWALGLDDRDRDRKQIHFHIKRHEGAWKAYADEIEAALSLWLYSVDQLENGASGEHQGRPPDGRGAEKSIQGETPRDAWLRKGTPTKRSLQLLGPQTAALYRDLQWWIPDGTVSIVGVKRAESEDGINSRTEVEAHRVVGFTSNVEPLTPSDNGIIQYEWSSPRFPNEEDPTEADCDAFLGVESFRPLRTLYAQHMFSAFMWAAAKTMELIKDEADVRPAQKDGAGGDSPWQLITLHSTWLSKMAQDIKSTGLGSLEEIYAAIIPPLSARNKLPRADDIIRWSRERAKQHELLGHWKEAADAYLWLFQTARTLPQGDIAIKATALLMEFLKAVTDAIKIRKAQKFEKRDIKELEELKSTLCSELRNTNLDTLARLLGLARMRHSSSHVYITSVSPRMEVSRMN